MRPRPLKPEHEQFAQLVAGGEQPMIAYQAAFPGFKSQTVLSAASSRLLNDVRIQLRINQLRAKVESFTVKTLAKAEVGAVLSLAEKRSFLASLVRTPVGQVNDQSPLAQEVTESTDEKGNSRKTVKMPGKLKALELDARLAGELDSSNIGLQVNILSVGGSVTTGI